jgi:hypothetical protein
MIGSPPFYKNLLSSKEPRYMNIINTRNKNMFELNKTRTKAAENVLRNVVTRVINNTESIIIEKIILIASRVSYFIYKDILMINIKLLVTYRIVMYVETTDTY